VTPTQINESRRTFIIFTIQIIDNTNSKIIKNLFYLQFFRGKREIAKSELHYNSLKLHL
jgi:hypothetical protein